MRSEKAIGNQTVNQNTNQSTRKAGKPSKARARAQAAGALPRAERSTVPHYVKTLAEMTAGVRDPLPPMTVAQRRQAFTPGSGAVVVIPEIADLASGVGITRVGEVTVEGMVEMHDRARVLAEVAKHAEAFVETLKDAQLRAQSESWKTALDVYAVLQRYARTDGNVAARLASVQAYFQARVRRGKVTETPEPEVPGEPEVEEPASP